MTRILIVTYHPLFGVGLESLLRQQDGLEVVGQETDVQAVIDQLKQLEPDVVILDSNGPSFDSTPDVMRLLKTNPGIKIVSLSLENNHLQIFEARQYVAERVEDLLNAIVDEPSPDGRC